MDSGSHYLLRLRYFLKTPQAKQIANVRSGTDITKIYQTFLQDDLKSFHLGTAIPKRQNVHAAGQDTLDLRYDVAFAVCSYRLDLIAANGLFDAWLDRYLAVECSPGTGRQRI